MRDIVTAIIHSFPAYLLLGAALYFVLVYHGKTRRGRVHEALIGFSFAVTALMLVHGAYVMPMGGAIISGVAGPMFFASYLGGPIAGLWAFVFSGTARYFVGGDVAIVGIVAQGLYVFGGLLGRKLAPADEWYRPPPRALGVALLFFLALHSLSVVWGVARGSLSALLTETVLLLVSYLVVGASLGLTWLIIRHVGTLSGVTRENSLRGQQLHMLYEEAGVGSFRFDAERADFVHDQSFSTCMV
ncbi:hypothetical protein N4R57_08795 [Rhodobacteraceae bacterium D3-12]|nr:hypothetical protein N4R57_08795 [Rhodobacteraceae bacterium D3-12]